MTDAVIDPDAVVGCLLGQAVGDMMGLPAENLSPRRVARLFPNLGRPRFLFGYGMGSDDTEHACMTAQALLRSGGDVDRFRRSLAWRLRWWFAAGPPGIGLATAKACVRLWLGFPPNRSGVRSAGNGPAMRAAILGVCGGPNDLSLAVAYSTAVTHADSQALFGALLVADAAATAVRSRSGTSPGWADLLGTGAAGVAAQLPQSHLAKNMAIAAAAYAAGRSVGELAADLGLTRGVTGYIAHTVPVAVYALCKHPDDYRAAVESVIRLGGDTDTVAAITGALVGARVGKAGIPAEWLNRYADWPRSGAWIERLGRRLAKGTWRTTPQPAVPLAWWAVPARNLFFLLVVLAHVARRALPPY